MTSTEQTNLKNSLSALSACFSASALIQQYISQWKFDVDAVTNARPGVTSAVSGRTPLSVPVSTVANLPGSPATNDEAVVTDANSPTFGATVAGGGSTRAAVKYNGSAWKVE